MFQLINVVQISHHGDFLQNTLFGPREVAHLTSSKRENFILFRSKFDLVS
jgi:hypothetical protein